MPNAWNKTREVEDPYMEIRYGDWEWRILKAWQMAKTAKKNPYARYYCAVLSPFTYGRWEYGDVYVRDIPCSEDAIAAQAAAEARKDWWSPPKILDRDSL